jgi:hypothetical protein
MECESLGCITLKYVPSGDSGELGYEASWSIKGG